MKNREIKFRAWQDNQMLTQPISGVYGSQRFFGLLYEDTELMQYTNLKDRDGVDIYEDDIVDTHPFHRHQGNCKGRKRFQKVIFSYGSFQAEHFDFGWEGEGVITLSQCKVVGNIYSNHELLK